MKISNRQTLTAILAAGLFLSSLFTRSWSAEEAIRDPQTLQDITAKLEALLQKKPLQLIKAEALEKDLQIFKSFQLLNLFALDPQSPIKPLLTHTILPDGGSYGTFAYDGKELIDLSRSKEKFAQILAKEGTLSDPKIKPENMAHLIALVSIDEGTVQNQLVNGPEEILQREKWKDPKTGKESDTGYVVDKEVFSKIKKQITKPHWEDVGATRNLIFVCVSGWMHETNTLIQYTVLFDKKTAQFEIKKETLAEKIFSKIPRIMY